MKRAGAPRGGAATVILWLVAAIGGCGDNLAGPAPVDAAHDAPDDAPDIDAHIDGLEVDAPAVDAPAVDTPDVDAPTVDAPAVDAPAIDAPDVDAPAIDAPAIDASIDAVPGDGGTCTAANLRVTNDAGGSTDPVLVWNGSGYGVGWAETRDGNSEIYFALLDADGTKLGNDIRVTSDAATSEGLAMVWTGSEYGLTWYDLRDGHYEIYFARLDASGAKQGGDVRVTNDPGRSWASTIAWSGSQYGLAWWDNRDTTDEIYFARLDAAGVKQGGDVRITTGGDASLPTIASDGSGFALAWGDSRDGGSSELYFARVDAGGVKQGGDVRITTATGSSDLPVLAYNGSGYGLGWEDSRTGAQRLWFVLLDAAGAQLSTQTDLTSRLFTPWNLVWNGAGYAMAWSDSRDGNLEIYFARLDAAGARVGTDLRLTDDPALSRSAGLAWNGSDYGVAWGDLRDGNWEVYFAHVCP